MRRRKELGKFKFSMKLCECNFPLWHNKNYIVRGYDGHGQKEEGG
jgi:hypothetical protein